MKHTIFALLKFNAIVGIIMFAFTVIAGSYLPNGDNIWVGLGIVLMWVYLIVGNVKIFKKNKDRVSKSIRDAALNATATAIQFKEDAKVLAKNKTENKLND